MNTTRIAEMMLVLIAFAPMTAPNGAFAQFPGRGFRGGHGSGEMRQKERAAPIQRDSREDIEYRLNLLQEDLHLTAEQETAWASYADKVRAIADDMNRERKQLVEKSTVLQQLDRVVDVARDRLTALEDVSAAARKLYAVLTPQQQMIADPRLANIVVLLVSPGLTANVNAAFRDAARPGPAAR